jgi:hypothetical protein
VLSGKELLVDEEGHVLVGRDAVEINACRLQSRDDYIREKQTEPVHELEPLIHHAILIVHGSRLSSTHLCVANSLYTGALDLSHELADFLVGLSQDCKLQRTVYARRDLLLNDAFADLYVRIGPHVDF